MQNTFLARFLADESGAMTGEQRLFDDAEAMMRLARARRVAAVNSSSRLSWVVEIDNDGVGAAELVYSQAPAFEQVVADARRHGVLGHVRVRSITTRATKPRPLLLLPWDLATRIGE